MSSALDDRVERYKLLQKIGQGTFGAVWKGEDDIVDIQEEIAALRGCRHPNITQYYGSSIKPGTSRLLIVMELMAVSVADLLGPSGGQGLSERAIAHVLRCVLKALAYLHSQQRMHRDVKAANVLLSGAGAVKVSDFGVSAQLSGTIGYKRRTFVGSPLWMAPEVIEQAPDAFAGEGAAAARGRADGYDAAADIWSLGITAIEMARGAPPRVEVSSFRLLFMIVRDEPPALEGPFSTPFKDFVWQCLRKDPAERPAPADLLQHPFVADAEDGAAELAALVAGHSTREALRLAGGTLRGADGAALDGAPGATLPAGAFATSLGVDDEIVASPRTDVDDGPGRGESGGSWDFGGAARPARSRGRRPRARTTARARVASAVTFGATVAAGAAVATSRYQVGGTAAGAQATLAAARAPAPNGGPADVSLVSSYVQPALHDAAGGGEQARGAAAAPSPRSRGSRRPRRAPRARPWATSWWPWPAPRSRTWPVCATPPASSRAAAAPPPRTHRRGRSAASSWRAGARALRASACSGIGSSTLRTRPRANISIATLVVSP
ncbi:hypothetical protein QBZ16_004017 [Prototheca wickerhamii]|uniref:Protein kinase domain-containing protein n=1 Tax=Prototheca wickerhamii TaxID=3111 RepID=A0AAD9MH81_PROWI|nr:hypothetical protein QBZ16_004017 [Prototheca wickerhamii]